ncbi:hypothetical protein VP01_3817g2 [Puccinia sorghi]|uniref:Integrase catalytic domain-containing protein n=1 Tax=Puccinia sorghi TaxID=27349 RepID=A0A0L6UTA1_9BASI|nr:hypothetical protein VP01_3817g2 [Puccinia sorghi]
MDSVTHNNVINSENRNSAKEMWRSIKERFASSQSSNRAQIFNEFLYLTFKEDTIESFITDVRISIKKMVDFNNESKAKTRDTTSNEAALYAGKNEKFNRTMRNAKSSQSSKGSRCTEGYHNPKQDSNHNSDSCWHLHPDKAPEWWRENQDKWKNGKDKGQVNYYMSLVTLWINHGEAKSRLILDSGASAHIFNDRRYFSKLELKELNSIKTGKAGATMAIKGTGEVTLQWDNRVITLKDCLYVPDIVINLISPGCLDNKGCVVSSSNGQFQVKRDSQVVLKGSVKNNLYTVDEPTSVGANLSEKLTALLSLQEIHESYGHASIGRLGRFIPNSFSNSDKATFECKSCTLSKITKQPFKGISTSAAKPFEKIHLDLIGPIDPESRERHRFILTVVDNYTGYLAGFPLLKKDDTTDVLINLLEHENKRLGYYPNWVCSDGGGEFVNKRGEQNIVGEEESPWKKMHGKELPIGYVKPIGTPAVFVNQRRIKGRKFHEKGEEGVLNQKLRNPEN